MTLLRTLICLAIIAVFTLATNFVMSKFQTDLENSALEYANLMDDIPTEIGVWKRTKTVELPGYALDQLKTIGAENWTYINQQTDEQVNLSFLVGPTGRLGVHTPEACMDGQGFKIGQNRQRESFPRNNDSSTEGGKETDDRKPGNSDDQDTFWRVVIASRVVDDFQIVSYYTLGTGKQWWAKVDPRFELAKYPFVLKMQVEAVTTSDPDSYNAARNFLKVFLPEVAKVYAETDLQGKYGK